MMVWNEKKNMYEHEKDAEEKIVDLLSEILRQLEIMNENIKNLQEGEQ